MSMPAHNALTLVAEASAISAILFFAAWLLQQKTKNAGYVDVAWAYNLGLIAVLYALLGPTTGARKWALAAMVVVWSARLGTHLLLRVAGEPEDGRYKYLREHWQPKPGARFLIFFQAQALVDVLLSIPFLLVCVDTASAGAVGPLQIAAVALWLAAQIGESVADAQLARCRNTLQKTEVCRAGLWRYSRHPNYFFEWLIWVAWAIFAADAPHGWLAFLSPLLMLLFLYRVSGIPWTEQQSIRSKGDAYREYQRTTSAFVPWFPRAG
jgi:steroid 5-alpha reductase family enzyme